MVKANGRRPPLKQWIPIYGMILAEEARIKGEPNIFDERDPIVYLSSMLWNTLFVPIVPFTEAARAGYSYFRNGNSFKEKK